jgi:hypothetical protein
MRPLPGLEEVRIQASEHRANRQNADDTEETTEHAGLSELSSMMVAFALPSMSVTQERSDFGMGTLSRPGPEAAMPYACQCLVDVADCGVFPLEDGPGAAG